MDARKGRTAAGPSEPETGIEPVTPTLPRLCSAPELLGLTDYLTVCPPLDNHSAVSNGHSRGCEAIRAAHPRASQRRWWAVEDSNLRRLSQLIYSQSRLSTSVTARDVAFDAPGIIASAAPCCQGPAQLRRACRFTERAQEAPRLEAGEECALNIPQHTIDV